MEIELLKKQKDVAYWERNQLVIALSKIFPSYLMKHPKEDINWDNDWRTIVAVELPKELILTEKEIKAAEYYMGMHMPPTYNNQLTWHIHDSEIGYFDHLEYREHNDWDGHDTEEKYRRLRKLKNMWKRKEE